MTGTHDRRAADDHEVAAARRVPPDLPLLRQGAVGHVTLVDRGGELLVEKRLADPLRHHTEVVALPALALPVPAGLPHAPDDDATMRRYRAAGGPPLPWSPPPAGPSVFCHGDWTDGNLLAVDGTITAVLDWEAAFAGEPLRELARIAWSAGRKDPGVAAAVIAAYGADPAVVRAWTPVHAAELWLWFTEAGPPEYLEQLTTELEHWPAD